MVKAEPDIITTEKRIQHKRNRLFLTGCILLLFAGLFWLISWMQHFELETFYAMATINPVDLSIAVGRRRSRDRGGAICHDRRGLGRLPVVFGAIFRCSRLGRVWSSDDSGRGLGYGVRSAVHGGGISHERLGG